MTHRASIYDQLVTRREPELWVAFADALAAYERREKSGQAPSRKMLTILPDDGGGWRVELEGGEGIAARFSSEQDALRATRAFATANAPADVQLYDSAGKLQAQFSYDKELPDRINDGRERSA